MSDLVLVSGKMANLVLGFLGKKPCLVLVPGEATFFGFGFWQKATCTCFKPCNLVLVSAKFEKASNKRVRDFRLPWKQMQNTRKAWDLPDRQRQVAAR